MQKILPAAKLLMKEKMNTGGLGPLRPYEKFESLGAGSLTDAELVAVIIKSGVSGKSSVELAEEVLYGSAGKSSGRGGSREPCVAEGPRQSFPDMGLARLMRITEDELKSLRGIGRVKTIQLMCLAELSRRIAVSGAAAKLDIRDPGSVAQYYMETLRHKSEEEVHLMLLTCRDTLITSVMVSRGTVNASVVSPREIFIAALRHSAAAMILVHNHPSGDPEPSREDIQFSQSLYRLGKIMNIPLRDSVIIGDNIYLSFLERGLFRE